VWPYPDHHDLKFLFQQLKTKTRLELRKKHDAIPHQNRSLDELLEMGGETFMKVRYLFEHQDQIEYGLNWLGETVRQRILSLHPDWESSDATLLRCSLCPSWTLREKICNFDAYGR
jgi:hypothetical protein